jgi:hypothetical protein
LIYGDLPAMPEPSGGVERPASRSTTVVGFASPCRQTAKRPANNARTPVATPHRSRACAPHSSRAFAPRRRNGRRSCRRSSRTQGEQTRQNPGRRSARTQSPPAQKRPMTRTRSRSVGPRRAEPTPRVPGGQPAATSLVCPLWPPSLTAGALRRSALSGREAPTRCAARGFPEPASTKSMPSAAAQASGPCPATTGCSIREASNSGMRRSIDQHCAPSLATGRGRARSIRAHESDGRWRSPGSVLASYGRQTPARGGRRCVVIPRGRVSKLRSRAACFLPPNHIGDRGPLRRSRQECVRRPARYRAHRSSRCETRDDPRAGRRSCREARS